ncbi:hypothetical protein L1049_024291 [Liquidambar formosana]|uniref:GAGA-binding transcriptional activator n=1 Tax=Liquidambar formosana TaxID=63359 RepID=A0AAP0S0G0_LIQFO
MEQLMKSYMAILAERDAAIRERNMALVEKKKALADRDMAILQRDAAIAQRNSAILERDDAIDALQCRESSMNENNLIHGPPGHGMPRGTKLVHHQQHITHLPHFAEAAYSPREVPFSDAIPNSAVDLETAKSKKVKRTKETKAVSSKKSSKVMKKGKRGTKVLSKQVTIAATNGWKNEQDWGGGGGGGGEELNNQLGVSESEWKDLGLNQVNFDDTTMPVPVCSCTGVLQPCYKWGNGGWQSACCTTTLSMYPLPQMPNKRRSRLGGRKMSGSAFNKLLSRLAAEGHDLSAPLDLKDHWAKHGTNRYITIK